MMSQLVYSPQSKRLKRSAMEEVQEKKALSSKVSN